MLADQPFGRHGHRRGNGNQGGRTRYPRLTAIALDSAVFPFRLFPHLLPSRRQQSPQRISLLGDEKCGSGAIRARCMRPFNSIIEMPPIAAKTLDDPAHTGDNASGRGAISSIRRGHVNSLRDHPSCSEFPHRCRCQTCARNARLILATSLDLPLAEFWGGHRLVTNLRNASDFAKS